MRSPLRLGLLLGLGNALVAVGVLALCERLSPGSRGWFAYAPLTDVVYVDRPFPWAYVAVPVSLLLLNVVVALGLRRR